MVIFNTTYHVANETIPEFIAWLRSEYVPQATADRMLLVPQLTRIIGSERDGGTSFALQFRAQSLNSLEIWQRNTGKRLNALLTRTFGNNVLGFSTVMEKIDI
ncbi:MAG: DUF4286 family protein [Muribaculaceae bacterium]